MLSALARLVDQRRTRAIAKYVQDTRDTLEAAIEDFHDLDKNGKRNELLRLGRKRFHAESADIQDRYKRLVGLGDEGKHQDVGACAGADSGEKHQGVQASGGVSGGAANEKAKQQQDPARSPIAAASSLEQPRRENGVQLLGCATPSPGHASARAAESAPKRAKHSEAQAPRQGVVASGRAGGQAETEHLFKNEIYAKHSMLVKIFGDERAADVLASTFRFLKEMRPFLQCTDIAVETAAILGMAVKHSLSLGDEEADKVKQVWKKVAGTTSILAVKAREICLINAWGLGVQ